MFHGPQRGLFLRAPRRDWLVAALSAVVILMVHGTVVRAQTITAAETTQPASITAASTTLAATTRTKAPHRCDERVCEVLHREVCHDKTTADCGPCKALYMSETSPNIGNTPCVRLVPDNQGNEQSTADLDWPELPDEHQDKGDSNSSNGNKSRSPTFLAGMLLVVMCVVGTIAFVFYRLNRNSRRIFELRHDLNAGDDDDQETLIDEEGRVMGFHRYKAKKQKNRFASLDLSDDDDDDDEQSDLDEDFAEEAQHLV
ncbi:uncharacterized protein MONBRDRAFT_26054 [Monosiga brevicollis MX1]|uniref:Uncharacterized protein n=1 Tax=Monosiga brevicollis TaxID=81824 RepID=A9V185_MONBE|nr:uncharacterized protein MONBRDRAFT_26054 [Monosiga brevicollis MX1]EDQ88765.1 predicted protein [Monosiga brevicollis MX1]|eukprot:XP_001746378.1 hypothetical protein [Monosiga brevicollis MX1]